MNIASLIDRHLEKWMEIGANFHPGIIPLDMTILKNNDGWTQWKPIPSTVTDEQLNEIQNTIGATFPKQFVTLLKHRHFIELQIGEISLASHPSDFWRLSLSNMAFDTWPKEWLIDKGYMPFATYSDWGMWCFGINQLSPNGECPVYQWDHEIHDKFDLVGQDLLSSLMLEISK